MYLSSALSGFDSLYADSYLNGHLNWHKTSYFNASPHFWFLFSLSLIIYLMVTSLLWLNFIMIGFPFSMSHCPFCLTYEFPVEVDLRLSDVHKNKTFLEAVRSCSGRV